jgi:hypothetical protein
MIESPIARIAVFVVILLAAGALLGFVVHTHLAGTDASADSRSLAQIQEQMNGIEKRIGVLETRRKAESAKAPPDVKGPETAIPSQGSIPRAPQTQFQISPAFTHHPQPQTAQPSLPDPASAQRLATLERGVGALQEETGSNREALQAATNRLAEVAGELGVQDGQIIKNQDELNRFLGRTEHTAITFELRRSSGPAPVGPVRISLKTSNQKSQRYTLCVYLQDSCVQVRDRVVYEVVQLALSRDTGAARIDRNKGWQGRNCRLSGSSPRESGPLGFPVGF